MPDMKINNLLLVEDDDNDIIITKRKLARSYVNIGNIDVVKDLPEAINTVKKNKYDVIILDLNLPSSRGLQTLEAITKEYKCVIIVLTSLDDTDIGLEAIRKGADDFLVKNGLQEKEFGRSIYFAIERRKLRNIQNRIEVGLNKLDELMNTGTT